MHENDIISFNIEKELFTQGYKIIAGIDEAGRGALAGPLVLGLVIYDKSVIQNPSENILVKIQDSKRLKPSGRLEALDIIQNFSTYMDTIAVSHRFIDKYNVNLATEYAVRKLYKKAVPSPDIIIMDGNFKFDIGIQFRSIIRGDSKAITIASASIAAKVKRDGLMGKYELKYPGYFFSRNMGYGTRKHMEALSKLGPCSIHRTSYKPVKGLALKKY